jgi:hypothetical protein
MAGDWEYDSNYPVWLSGAGITPPSNPVGIRGMFKAILANLNAVGVGGMLARVTYAPATVDTATPIVSSTGLTSLNFTTGADQPFTFIAPASGSVLVNVSCFIKGGAAAASSTVLGLVSTAHTTSPGTVVGVAGLASLTPTATAADNGQYCTMKQIITGLTAAQSYTWYPAAMYSGTATSILAQGTTSQTTVPTGAPLVVEVWTA